MIKHLAVLLASLFALASFSCDASLEPSAVSVLCRTDRTEYSLLGYLGMDTIRAAITSHLSDTVTIISCSGVFTLEVYKSGRWVDALSPPWDCLGWFIDLAPGESIRDRYILNSPTPLRTGLHRLRFAYGTSVSGFISVYSNPFRLYVEHPYNG